MSSNTTIFSRPTTVIFRILCGSSHDRCMCATLPDGKRRKQKTTSSMPGLDEVLAVGDDLRRLLAEEPEDHGEVVDAERPERVLVRADHAEVLAVAVDAGNVAELARVDELLHLAQARVVEQQVARHQDAVVRARERHELLHLLAAHRGRLLDEDVLARLERLLRERVVRRHRRRDRRRRRRVSSASASAKRAGHRRLRVARRVVGLRAPRRCRSPRRGRPARRITRTTFLPQPPTPAWATRVTTSRPSRR